MLRAIVIASLLAPAAAQAALVRVDFEGVVHEVTSLSNSPFYIGQPVQGTLVYESDPASLGVVDSDPNPAEGWYVGPLVHSLNVEFGHGAYVVEGWRWLLGGIVVSNQTNAEHPFSRRDVVSFGTLSRGESVAGRIPGGVSFALSTALDVISSDRVPTAAELRAFEAGPPLLPGLSSRATFGPDGRVSWTVTSFTAVPEFPGVTWLALVVPFLRFRPVS